MSQSQAYGQGTLFVVATPIGNLEDITLRAVRTLKEADVILCEDTRVTKKLLDRFAIEGKSLVSYHAHSKLAKVEQIFALLEEAKHLALVSDAGTPAISDPGSLLVAQVRERFGDSVKIEPIPGPSAVTAALSVSGFPTSEYLFLGFLPHKKGRETLFKEIAAAKRAVVFYESPHRIQKALVSLAKYAPAKTVMIGREVTKMFEEFAIGLPEELAKRSDWRGEIVVIVKGS